MHAALITALLFTGSRDSSLVSLALGIAAGLATVLISKRLRRKEDR